MKTFQKANRVLGGVAVLFGLLLLLKLLWPQSLWVRCLFAVAEAAFVGGIADWFAVTALFARPLGFPWHTALIPRSRQRLIAGTAQLVQEKFFSQAWLQQLLAQWSLTEAFIRWVEEGKGRYVLLLWARALLRAFLNRLEPAALAATAQGQLRELLRRWQAAPALLGLAREAVASGRAERLWDGLFALLLAQLRQGATQEHMERWARRAYEQELARLGPMERLFAKLLEGAGQIDPADFAQAAQAELAAFLEQLQADAQHPVRLWLREKVLEALAELERPEQAARLERWKEELLRQAPLQEVLEQLLALLRAPAAAPGERPAPGESLQAAFVSWVLEQLMGYWEDFKRNGPLRAQLEACGKEALWHLAVSRHHLIGEVVEHAMSGLSDERLNRLVQEKAGEDLNWLRINGCLVGGLIGLALFWLLELVK